MALIGGCVWVLIVWVLSSEAAAAGNQRNRIAMFVLPNVSSIASLFMAGRFHSNGIWLSRVVWEPIIGNPFFCESRQDLDCFSVGKVRCVERSVEGLHCIVKRCLGRGPNLRASTISLELRLPQLLHFAISEPQEFAQAQTAWSDLGTEPGFRRLVLGLGLGSYLVAVQV